MPIRKIIFSFVLLFLYLNLNAQTINISALHENDANGVPNLLGQSVTIQGKITVSNQFGSISYIEDETGGVAIYDANFLSQVQMGELVTVIGTVDQYSGLTELKSTTITEQLSGSEIEPQLVTCSDLASEGQGGVENFEGELLRINNVKVDTDFWSVSGSGTNYTLTDATGSLEIRIDNDTDIANTIAPGDSTFDVIGVLSQYDYSSPYTDGYQLMPRSLDDIIFLSGPRIVSGPDEFDMTTNSMNIKWETDEPANSILMYGETENYEIDTLQISEAVYAHQVSISGLLPGTVYQVKVASEDGTGTSYSPNLTVITCSDLSSTGQMNVYFNKSADQSLANVGNEANENIDVEQKFIDRVNGANFSIDICYYSWDLSDATNAVINAFNRGVKVRFIHDEDHQHQNQVSRLKSAGITVIDQSFSNLTSYGIQHNKFVIFDARDNSSYSDDWVWTGSLNMTNYNELGVNAAQNVIEIQDQSLAKAYMLEFNEMWGAEGDTPNAAASLFGANKTDNTPHKFIINNIPVEMYMCPSDHVTGKIINAIETANREIYFCVLSYTRVDVNQAMEDKFTTIDNFQVRGVFDHSQSYYSQYFSMHGEGDYAWDPPADVWLDGEYGVLHHKYMLIDAHWENSDPITISGSQNWSTSAETKNDENTLIIHDANITNLYLQEFADRYHAAGGSSNLTSVEISDRTVKPGSYSLYQNYPNPFNSATQIEFVIQDESNIQLSIFNINGQNVRRFELGKLQAGKQRVSWDGLNDSGERIAGGVYFYSLKILNAGSQAVTKKMIYLP